MGGSRRQINRGSRQVFPDHWQRSRAGGYKACVSLTKLGKRYGKKKLEAACEHMLTLSSSSSIRTITTLLKDSK